MAAEESTAFEREHIPTGEGTDARVHRLQRELEKMRERLQATVEAFGSSVAELRRRNEALKEQAEGYLDVAGVMFVALDREGRVTLINRKGCEILGYAEDEIVGVDWFEHFLPERDRAPVRRIFEGLRTADVGAFEYIEKPVVTKSGHERLILWHNAVLRDECGELSGTLSSGTDITERKRAEERLRESEQRFRNLFESSPDAVFVEDLQGNVMDVNPAACRLHDAGRDALVGMNVRDLVPPDRRETAMHAFDRLIRGEVRRLQSFSWTVNQRAIPVEIRASRFTYRGQPAVLLHVRDVTEQRRLEQEVLRISEEERQRIGQDIHDELASQFSGIALLVRGLLRQWQQGQAVSGEMLEEVARLARTGAEQARALARGLAPVRLERQGLEAALKELAHDTETLSGVSCSFEADEGVPALKGDVATQLYRIAHEATTNAVEHARTEHLAIRLLREANRLVLVVQDEGEGLPEDHGASEGMGLHVMPYRARMIGATFGIDSVPGKGTTVTCSLPLDATALE